MQSGLHIFGDHPNLSTSCLTAQKSRGILTDVNTIIVDEITPWPTTSWRPSDLSLERLDAPRFSVPCARTSANAEAIATVAPLLPATTVRSVVVNIGHSARWISH